MKVRYNQAKEIAGCVNTYAAHENVYVFFNGKTFSYSVGLGVGQDLTDLCFVAKWSGYEEGKRFFSFYFSDHKMAQKICVPSFKKISFKKMLEILTEIAENF